MKQHSLVWPSQPHGRGRIMPSVAASARAAARRRPLKHPDPQSSATARPWPPCPGQITALERRDDTRRAALDIVRTGRRTLALHSATLDPAVYDQPAMLEALALLARRHGAQVRIVVREPRVVTARGHRLLDLARRLSSTMELRRPHPQHLEDTEQLLIVDERAVLYRPFEVRPEGWASLDAPAEARRRLKAFEERWGLAEPDPELQRLYL